MLSYELVPAVINEKEAQDQVGTVSKFFEKFRVLSIGKRPWWPEYFKQIFLLLNVIIQIRFLKSVVSFIKFMANKM